MHSSSPQAAFWASDRHPCKSLVNRKARDSCKRSGERVVAVIRTCRSRTFCLSADGSCVYAEPDIHLRSRAAKSCHRRLSLCSLPVPKQLVESLGSCLRRPAGHLRDLAACASSNPDVFPFFRKGFYTAAAGENSPAGMKPVPRLSTASMCATILRATASVALPPCPRCRSRSYSRANSWL